MIPVSRMSGHFGRVLALIQLLWMLPAGAQWITQTNSLKSGWNAVYLHVDASYASITDVMASATPIEEVWLWTPSSTQQFIDSPQVPTGSSSQWSTWTRALGPTSKLQRLVPNAAYYVKVASTSATYSWNIKGRPVPPQYNWTSSGLNFIGFPTPADPISFERLFQPVPSLMEVAEIYRSSGGAFGAGNPVRVSDYGRTVFTRGEAFWMRVAAGYNRYFGPFEVSLSGNRTLNYGTDGTQLSFRIRNQTRATNTITLELIPSEAPPTGQSNIVAIPPLVLRGSIDPTTLKYSAQPLFTNQLVTYTLPPQGTPGSDLQVVIGLGRNQLVGNAGDLSAGVLRLTDSAGLLRVDLGVSATKSSSAGLWVGEAQVTHVVQYLKIFERDPSGKPVVRLGGEDGGYSALLTNEVVGGVSRPFPMRLIVHDNGTNAVMLQRVFVGVDTMTNPVVTTQQRFLHPGRLGAARRISAAHLPWSSSNDSWALTLATNISQLTRQWPVTLTSNVFVVQVNTPYDRNSVNPFIHQYHPDHDNLNASFTQVLPKGQESYGVNRTLILGPQSSGSDYVSLTTGSMDRTGIYGEMVTIEGSGANTRSFIVIGTYTLNRISDIPTLTR